MPGKRIRGSRHGRILERLVLTTRPPGSARLKYCESLPREPVCEAETSLLSFSTAMATSQAILAQALPATSPVASTSAVSQRKAGSANLAAPFKGSVSGLRWESNGAVVALVWTAFWSFGLVVFC